MERAGRSNAASSALVISKSGAKGGVRLGAARCGRMSGHFMQCALVLLVRCAARDWQVGDRMGGCGTLF